MKKQWETFKRYRFLLWNLISRDLKVKYRRSFLGFAWSILNPFLMMLVITAVFSTLFRFEIEYFPIYYLSGVLIYNFVVEATNGAMTSILGASSLIKKVYIPKYIFPLEKCVFAFVNMLFSLVAVIIMILILQMPISWPVLLFPIPLIYAFVFSVGLGMILAAGNVFFRDIGHLYGVFTTAWMYLTPIIYPLGIIPSWMMPVIKLNPLYHFIEYFRGLIMCCTKVYHNPFPDVTEGVEAFVYSLPSLSDNLLCAGIALLFLVVGVLVFRKSQDRFILYI